MSIRYEAMPDVPPRFLIAGDEDLFREFAPVWMAEVGDATFVDVANKLVRDLERDLRRVPGLPALLLLFAAPPLNEAAIRAATSEALAKDVIVRVLPTSWLDERAQTGDDVVALLRQMRRARRRDPFDLARPASPDEFFGLEGLLDELRGADVDVPILLHGMRTSGKTSVAQRLVDYRRGAGWITPRTIEGFGGDCVATLKRLVEVVAEASDCRPAQWADPARPSSPEALAALEQCALRIRQQPGKVAFIALIDEADDLVPRGDDNDHTRAFYTLLHVAREAARQRLVQTVFVALDSEIATRNRFPGDAGANGNPLFNKCFVRRMEPLRPEEAQRFLSETALLVGYEWTPDGLTRATQASGGHPFLLRRLGSGALSVSRARSKQGAALADDDVARAIARELEGGCRCAEYFRAQLESLGPAATAIIESLRDLPMRQSEIRQRLQPQVVSGALRDLDDAFRLTQAYRLVVRDSEGRLDLFAPMFRDWLRDYR